MPVVQIRDKVEERAAQPRRLFKAQDNNSLDNESDVSEPVKRTRMRRKSLKLNNLVEVKPRDNPHRSDKSKPKHQPNPPSASTPAQPPALNAAPAPSAPSAPAPATPAAAVAAAAPSPATPNPNTDDSDSDDQDSDSEDEPDISQQKSPVSYSQEFSTISPETPYYTSVSTVDSTYKHYDQSSTEVIAQTTFINTLGPAPTAGGLVSYDTTSASTSGIVEASGTSTPSSQETNQPALQTSAPSKSSHSNRSGAIAGGVIGGLLFLAGASILLYFLLKRLRSTSTLQKRKRSIRVFNRPLSPDNQQPDMSDIASLVPQFVVPPPIIPPSYTSKSTPPPPGTPRTRARRFRGPLALNPITPPPTAARFPFLNSPGGLKSKFKPGAAGTVVRPTSNISSKSLPISSRSMPGLEGLDNRKSMYSKSFATLQVPTTNTSLDVEEIATQYLEAKMNVNANAKTARSNAGGPMADILQSYFSEASSSDKSTEVASTIRSSSLPVPRPQPLQPKQEIQEQWPLSPTPVITTNIITAPTPLLIPTRASNIANRTSNINPNPSSDILNRTSERTISTTSIFSEIPRFHTVPSWVQQQGNLLLKGRHKDIRRESTRPISSGQVRKEGEEGDVLREGSGGREGDEGKEQRVLSVGINDSISQRGSRKPE